MGEKYYLDLFQNDQKLNVLERTFLLDKGIKIEKNYGLEIESKKEDEVNFKINYFPKKYCVNDVKSDILDVLNRDNNFFMLKLNDRNKVEKILNKKMISESIENKIFKYMKNNPENSTIIINTIRDYKILLEEENYHAEDKMNSEGVSSFLFFDMNNKTYYTDKITNINHFIGGIIPFINVPMNLKFRIREMTADFVILEFQSEYNEGILSYASFMLTLKEILGYPMNEKYIFDFQIDSVYKIKRENSEIIGFNIQKNINLNGNKYKESIILKNVDYS